MNKTAISCVFFLFLLLTSLAVAAAQGPTSSSLVISPSGLVLVGKEGVDNATGRLSFVETANETVEVRLLSSDLIDNGSGKVIPSSELTLTPVQFNISRNEKENVGVMVITRGVSVGTYRGTILVIVTPIDENSTAMNAGVSVRIETAKTFFGFDVLNWNFQSWLVILLGVLTMLGYEFGSLPDVLARFKTHAVVLISILIGYIWVYTIVNFTFGDLNTAVSTVLVAPFLAHSANFLNEKRTQRNSREAASVTVLKEGTKDDVDLVRNIIGELATHYASFEPNLYAKSDSQAKGGQPNSANNVNVGNSPEGDGEILTPQILFNERGVLSREVWDKSCKQGRVADLPILQLEKYYDFIKLYNRYYSWAMMMTTGKTEEEFERMSKETLFRQFKAFRKAYAELETVLFANLSYDMGLFTRTTLSPLDTQYPRITRPLLVKLIDYNILETTEYPKSFWRRRLRRQKEKTADAKGLARTLRIKKDADKGRIKDWKISAKGLEQISEEIYRKDKIPAFYDAVEDDFQRRYAVLLKCAESLLSAFSLPREFIDLETTPTFLQEHAILKDLLDELDKLKKLLDAEAITNEEFERRKKRILEKISMLSDKPRMLAFLEGLQRLSVLLQHKEITQDEYDREKKKLMDKL